MRQLSVIRPNHATDSELLAYHDPEYIAFILNPENSKASENGKSSAEYSTFGIEDVY